ncbi:MAG TPA: BON domain-containing protein [Burkholderiales bacterium]
MMKTLIAASIATAFAMPALAQQSNLPNDKERAQNREKVQDKLPTSEERAGNRREVSKSAAGAALTSKVKTALASDAGMRTMTNIDVDSADGVVTLKGKVDTADAKKKAEAIAKKVEGVKRVKNELKVEAKKSS